MMRRALAAGTVALALATSAPAVQADAAPTAPVQCAIKDRSLVCGRSVETPGYSGSGASAQPPERPDRAGSGQPTAIWTTEPFYVQSRLAEVNFQGFDACLTPSGARGVRTRYTLLAPSGAVLETFVRCDGDEEEGSADPSQATPVESPVVPPAPPTREELIEAAPIPDPVINRNPSTRGLTGLASWFWASIGTTVDASVTLRGWTVTGTLGAGTLTWDTGDGGRYQTTTPGTADAPAVEHVYERKGTWPVSVNVAWSGSYTVSGYGTSYTVGGLTTEGTTSLDYEVVEVRSVLDDQGGA
jgi:hypothetical protein